MSQTDDSFDSDFDAQLQGLFQQAERAMSHRPGERGHDATAAAKSDVETGHAPHSGPATKQSAKGPMPAFLKPLVQGLEAVTQATAENSALLRKIDPAGSDNVDAQKGILQLMADLRAIVEARNTVSQNMFSALHQELKGYKDGFLLQTVHRPIIRDLVTLYDDISELHRQLTEIDEPCPEDEGAVVSSAQERVRQVATNMSHNMDFILEVLARLEVTVMPPGMHKLDKLSQKAVSLEPAETQEEDGQIVRSVKRGFLWKDAVLRPEEVVIKKWKRVAAAADGSSPAK
jgi:molecular chaperone GrpE (heat shock protein)